MTGPSCIDGSINDCWLTAPGTARNTDSRRTSGGSGSVIAPAPQPQPAPQPAPQPPYSPAPQPPPAPAPSGSCVSSGADYYAAACAALEATCEQYSFCKRASAGGSSPAAAPSLGACVSNDASIHYS